MTLETQEYLQQFFEKDAETINAWFDAACQAHPKPPFGYEGLKANTGFLVITFGALESFLVAGKTIEDYIAAQRTPVQNLRANAEEMETPSVDSEPKTRNESKDFN